MPAWQTGLGEPTISKQVNIILFKILVRALMEFLLQ